MTTARLTSLGRLWPNRTAVFVCDIQEKFRNSIKYFPEIVCNTTRILDAAKALQIPVVYTEQYPKGLGMTIPELDITARSGARFEKMQFSMVTPQLHQYMKEQLPKVDSVVLCGIETHACIRHTAMDLVNAGFGVHVVVDCCSSRNPVDRKYALKAIEKMGCHMITTESVILGLVPDSGEPVFKQLQKIVRHPSADTEL